MYYTTPQSVSIAAVLLPTLGTVCVALRFCARRVRRTTWRADDWLILLGQILVWGLATIVIIGAGPDGLLGRHSDQFITNKNGVMSVQILGLKLMYIYSSIEPFTLGIIKISVVFFYRRIFRGSLFPVFNRATISLLVILAVWALTFTFLTIFQCGLSPWAQWTSLKAAHDMCRIDNSYLATSFAVTDVVTDIAVLSVPVPMVLGLQMSKSRKVGVLGIFFLGAMTTTAGVGRLAVYIYNTFYQTPGERDLANALTDLLLWSLVQASLAVVAACLPTIRPIFLQRSPQASHDYPRDFLKTSSEFVQSSGTSGQRHGSHGSGFAEDYNYGRRGSQSANLNYNYPLFPQAQATRQPRRF